MSSSQKQGSSDAESDSERSGSCQSHQKTAEMPDTCVRLLIKYMGEPMNMQQRLDGTRDVLAKKALWGELLDHLQEHGYAGTKWEGVKKKWDHLCSKFRKELSLSSASGAEKSAWIYFKAMKDAVGTRPKFRRNFVVDSEETPRKKHCGEVCLPDEDLLLDIPAQSKCDEGDPVGELFDDSPKGEENLFPRMKTFSKCTPQQQMVHMAKKSISEMTKAADRSRDVMENAMQLQLQEMRTTNNLLSQFLNVFTQRAAPVPPVPSCSFHGCNRAAIYHHISNPQTKACQDHAVEGMSRFR